MIEAIVFDFGGVIVSERGSKARLAEFDALLGWEPGTLNLQLYSGPAWEAVSTGRISVEHYWQKVGKPLEDRLPPDFQRFRDNFWGDQPDLAMIGLGRRLRKRYRLALLSNATRLLALRLDSEPDLRDLFDVRVISALAGTRKPEPLIYQILCRRLGLPPAACVLIDDRTRNTAAARALGMHAIEHRGVVETEQALRELGVMVG